MTAQAETETFFDQAARARDAARVLATLTRARKDAALLAMADALAEAEGALLEANARDVAAARGGARPALCGCSALCAQPPTLTRRSGRTSGRSRPAGVWRQLPQADALSDIMHIIGVAGSRR